jgi:hypothetical protein
MHRKYTSKNGNLFASVPSDVESNSSNNYNGIHECEISKSVSKYVKNKSELSIKN